MGMIGAMLGLGSCSEDYDDRFNKLEQQLKDVIAQVEGAAELSTAIQALETQIASLNNAVGQLPDGDALTGGLSALGAEITALEAELAALGESQATSGELETLVAGLTSDLDLLKSDLDDLLESSNVFTGNLIIFDDNTLAAAKALGDKVRIVTGKVQINAVGMSETADLDVVTSKIVAAIGEVNINTDRSIDFSRLETVGDDFTVIGNTIDLSGLRSVGDDLQISWEGDYDFSELLVVGDDIRLGVEESSAPTKNANVGKAVSRIINFRKVRATGVQIIFGAQMSLNRGVEGMDGDWDSRTSELFFPNATEIIFGDVPVGYVVAPMASNIELHYEGDLDGDLFIVSTATTITVKASDVGNALIMGYPFDEDDSIEDFVSNYDEENFGMFEAPANWVSDINLPNLESVTGDLYLISHSLQMPMLEEFGMDEDDDYDLGLTQENIALPNLTVEGRLHVSGTTKTIEFASISDAYIRDATTITSLRANALRNDLTESTIGIYEWDALTTVRIFGATGMQDAITIDLNSDDDEEFSYLPVLETLELGGVINNANVEGVVTLTTLITSGNINNLEITNNDKLTSLSLGHTHIEGSAGSMLTVSDNALLASVKTDKLDFIKTLTVTGNAALTSVDFNSMKTLLKTFDGGTSPTDGVAKQIVINISDNKIAGKVTQDVPVVGTAAYQNEIIESASIYSFKPLADALVAYAAANEMEVYNLYDEVDFKFGLDEADITTTTEVEKVEIIAKSADKDYFYIWTATTNRIEGISWSELGTD